MPSAPAEQATWRTLIRKSYVSKDREIAGVIAEELGERGFEVGVAFSGQEGVLAVMRSTPDLVVCDINMPHMTGFEVLERLNEIAPRIGHIPFIFFDRLCRSR
jgi:CheY-like chemotaxis protein